MHHFQLEQVLLVCLKKYLIDTSVLQFHKKLRHGMVPSGLPQELEEWEMTTN